MSTDRKKILVFTTWYLPGYKAGGPIRSLANLVSKIDHDFYIITGNKDHHSTMPYEGIVCNHWIKQSSNSFVYYLDEESLNTVLIRHLMREKQWDFIYLNSLFSLRFSLLPLRTARKMGYISKTILAPRGMLQEGALSVKPFKKKIFLLISRIFGLFDNITWHATSDAEFDAIKNKFKKSRIKIAPNLSASRSIIHDIRHKKKGELKLISIARISPEKGILEAVKYLTGKSFEGEISAVFFGTKQNTDYLNECLKYSNSRQNVKISFPGEITPLEIPEELNKAHFFYLPTLGENHGHAIVEAFQNGLPVIISNKTPWRNLESFKAGWDLDLNIEKFTNTIAHALSMDHDEYEVLCTGAAEFGTNISNSTKAVELNMQLFE